MGSDFLTILIQNRIFWLAFILQRIQFLFRQLFYTSRRIDQFSFLSFSFSLSPFLLFLLVVTPSRVSWENLLGCIIQLEIATIILQLYNSGVRVRKGGSLPDFVMGSRNVDGRVSLRHWLPCAHRYLLIYARWHNERAYRTASVICANHRRMKWIIPFECNLRKEKQRELSIYHREREVARKIV